MKLFFNPFVCRNHFNIDKNDTGAFEEKKGASAYTEQKHAL